MSNYFADENLFYFGHDIIGNISVIKSILKKGLKVIDSIDTKGYSSHLRGLDSTSISLGSGSNHFLSYHQNLLDNWPHNEAKKIVIIALPAQFVLSHISSSPNADLYKAFYVGSDENGYSIRPELVRGYYDADSKTFTPNENFYQNLNDDKKKKFFDDLASCYIDNYANYSVRSPIDDLDFPRDYVDDKTAAIQWYKIQLERLREYKKSDSQQANYDYSHDFDDTFYGYDSDIHSESSNGSENFEDSFDILIPEEEWDELLSNTTISDFNNMMQEIKTRNSKEFD